MQGYRPLMHAHEHSCCTAAGKDTAPKVGMSSSFGQLAHKGGEGTPGPVQSEVYVLEEDPSALTESLLQLPHGNGFLPEEG